MLHYIWRLFILIICFSGQYYRCKFFFTVSSWILSRSQNLLAKDLISVAAALSNPLVSGAGLSWVNYNVNDHTKEGCTESGASLATFTIFTVLVSSFVSKFLWTLTWRLNSGILHTQHNDEFQWFLSTFNEFYIKP